MIYGVTIDRTDRFSHQLKSLSLLPKRPTVRFVFDPGIRAEEYLYFCKQLKPIADIMGQFVDSESIKTYTFAKYQERVIEYVTVLKDYVDIWECGNEVNGDWCGYPYQVWQKVVGAIQEVKKRGKRAAVTYYYDLEPPENKQFEMFNWITEHPLKPDLALISVYENWYPGVVLDFKKLFTRFLLEFPDAEIGFGEFGPQPRKFSQSKRAAMIERYHAFSFPSSNWIGGWFYWDFSVDCKSGTPTLNAMVKSWK